MKLNKSISIIILVIFLFSLLGSLILAAERELEVEYPKLDEEEITPKTTLPEYVKYIFKFSLIIAGILAFAVLIYGGFRYLTSAGSPEAMRDAKSWIFGGILGLVLLLCSYLILTTINPELLSPKEPEIGPTTGIYLINAKDEKLYFIEDTPKITQEFETPPFGAISVMFFDDRPTNLNFVNPDKLELYAIFIYPEENYKGDPEKVENTKEPDDPFATSSLSLHPRSLRFLWHKPGVYLFEREKCSFEEATPPFPQFFKSSVENLKDFDNKTKAVLFMNIEEPYQPYQAVLFEHINFRGKCSWQTIACETPLPDPIRDKVSSIAIYKRAESEWPEEGEGHGEVIFYDQKNCLGDSNSYTWRAGDYKFLSFGIKYFDTDQNKLLENNVESFRINGNFSVILTTEPLPLDVTAGVIFRGDCQLFTKIGCTETLKGSSVYCWPWWRCRPKLAAIFPVAE